MSTIHSAKEVHVAREYMRLFKTSQQGKTPEIRAFAEKQKKVLWGIMTDRCKQHS